MRICLRFLIFGGVAIISGVLQFDFQAKDLPYTIFFGGAMSSIWLLLDRYKVIQSKI
ncbi:MAG: hypothetical protein AAGN35_22065 [Bacteroidota bacterium]